MRSYLLGELAEDEAGRVELRLFGEENYFEELELAEDELTDDYLRGELSGVERARFESHFLAAPERRHKLAFATALHAEASAASGARGRNVVPITHSRDRVVTPEASARLFSSGYLKVAAVLLVAVWLGFGVRALISRQSEVDGALLALGDAYKNERLVESRISGLERHAPLRQLRGDDRPAVDYESRDLAERLLLEALKKSPDDAAARHALGRLYLAERKFDRAEEQLRKALNAGAGGARIHSDAGAALLELGRAEGAGGDGGKASEYFGRSLEQLNRALALDASLPEALFNRALLYQHMLLPRQAADGWRKYLERDSASAWAEEARRNLRSLEEQSRDAARAGNRLYEAFVAARDAGDAEAARAALNRGRSRAGNLIVEQLLDEHLELSAGGRDEEAADRLRLLSFAGEVEARSSGDRFTSDLAAVYARADAGRRARLAGARGAAHRARAEYDRSEMKTAAELFAEAARLFKQSGGDGEALLAESWAGYSELRIPDAAAAHARFGRLSGVFAARGYKSLLAQSLHAQSDAETSFDELSRSLDYAGRALRAAEEAGDDATRVRCLQQFVSMHLRFGRYRESLKFAREAVELSRNLPPDPKLTWPFFHQAARAFSLLGLADAALEFQREALAVAEESRWPLIVARTHAGLATLHGERREYDAAVRSGLRALEEGRKIGDEKSRLNILSHASLRLAHVYRESGDTARALAAYDEAMAMFDKLGLGIYLYESRRGKFLTHDKRGDVTAAAAELSLALRAFDEYRGKIQEERNRTSFFDVNQDIYDLATDFAHTRLGDGARAFDYAETSRARSLLDLMRTSPQVVGAADGRAPDILHGLTATEPLALARIREGLPADVQLLQYSVLADKLIVWLVARDGFESRSVQITSDELGRKVAAYLRRLKQPGGDAGEAGGAEATEAAAGELYSVLVGPIESLLRRDALVCVVPDKVLTHLPFGALVSPKTGEYFVERHRSVVAPSANVFVRATETARERGAARGERALCAGNPSFARGEFPELSDLPDAGREAEQVAARYGASALVGARAREGRVREGMSNAEVVHLATHYVADERSPMLSRLLLADEPASRSGSGDDGALQTFEVYGMRLPRTRLVVLSACQTGFDHELRGEGAVGVARSFLSAGVPLVVASLWPVDSDATAALMIKFHTYRKTHGLTSADALRQAQLDMLRDPADEARRRPRAWASFVAYGGRADF